MYIYGVIALVILLIKISKVHQVFIFHKLIAGIFTNKTIRNISIIKFSSGIALAMEWGLLNILILQQLGSLSNWTKVSIVMAILGIIISYALKGVDTKNKSLVRLIISGSAMLFSIIPILLVVNFSLNMFIGFTFAKLIFDKINNILAGAYIYNIEKKDYHFNEKQVSYQMFSDFFLSLGQLLPIIILLYIPQELLNLNTLIIVLAVTSLFPFLASKAYKTSFKSMWGTG